MKYIAVTGGVVSGIGKGITISSIGRILKSSNVLVTSIKIDPYLNIDAGTMNPFEHGETFVLDDGSETDLDLGNYERFLDITLSGKHNITTGKIYREVINQERRGDYLGKTVQIVPHATDMVQSWIKEIAKRPVDGTGKEPDICLIEVGGTVGDIESMVFLEALRQFQFHVGRENIMFIHLSLVPIVGAVGEPKTKPTQHSVKELRGLGLTPDIIICRATEMLSSSIKNKISTFCHVLPDCVLSVHDVSNIYHVPNMLVEQGVHSIIKKQLGVVNMLDTPDLLAWNRMAAIVDNASKKVTIALVGKYTELSDAYLSVSKALKHSAIHLNVDVVINWIESSDLEEETKLTEEDKYNAAWSKLKSSDGILVPGGFGVRGVEGKIAAVKYARENKVPLLGVCLGMQVMVIEYVRNVLKKKHAHSAEFNEATADPVIIFMPEINQSSKGGTMRLGSRATHIKLHLTSFDSASLASDVYGGSTESIATEEKDSIYLSINERHRHRYEVNPEYVSMIEAAGMIFSGKDDRGERMEIAELSREIHPFYLGTQFHPEFKSRPNRPSPPFYAFLSMCSDRNRDISTAGRLWQDYEADIIKRNIEESLSSRAGNILKRSSSSSIGNTNSGGTKAVESVTTSPVATSKKQKS